MNWRRKSKSDWGRLDLNFKNLSEVSDYVNERVKVENLTVENYISTENMLPNKGGIDKATKLPAAKTTSLYSKGDILLSNIRTYFKKIWYTEKDGGCSNDVLVVRARGEIEPKFLYYVLSNDKFFEYSSATSKGTKMPRGDKSAIMQYQIPDMPLEEQRTIVSVLSALDDRIAENKKINHHLAEIAKSIFDSYFIDLSPYDGVMPDDWQLSNLTGIANYLNGLAMQKHRPQSNEQGLPVLKIKELRQGFTDSTSDLCSSNIRRDYIIHDGDVIFSWSGSLLVDFWTGGDCGLNQHLFKVSSETYDKWFYYAWTKHHLDRFVKMAADRATTMGHIKRDALEKAEVLIPSNKDYQEIGNKLKPIYDQIINNRVESRKLVALRDTLLPKLMSGEISATD
ncbi:restriction endonuclease subunit S [Lactococcus petauri]|uniref:restriction endonuclease subunit S n=2 Tax=Lactobacillales TaxID=186826 RepID=UPI00080F2441|nr:restriction endonuclease subunit S [Lactococcus petauri]MDT2558354.1 restriction endonuclease subunit S [Lactococcus petauri]SBW30417.1 Type I restriction modification DNA specificity domain protein [Lactococcus lactis subsp. lactis]